MPNSRGPSLHRSSRSLAWVRAAGQDRSAGGSGPRHRRAEILRGYRGGQEGRAWKRIGPNLPSLQGRGWGWVRAQRVYDCSTHPFRSPSCQGGESLAVAKIVDLARQAVFLVDGDPLEDLDPLLEFADLLPEALIFHLCLAIGAGASKVIEAAPHARLDD